ncbi:MAG: insulinase family protein [Spirochaetales bacterium]|nr:insulinase family protein [Spirochaetales bacterium]
MMEKGENYKGFTVKDVAELKELNSKGVYLIHEKSGLEIFHIVNDDIENLFAFTFLTPSQDETGVSHVVEHSVFCGSKKYPFKDPFIKLVEQSINTYLNAFTSYDRTVFPASSQVKEEYFNLMSVYADAVFFPRFDSEIFSQECWHLELDEKNNPKIQGVVYNEMKGWYSSFENVADSLLEKSILGGTFYKNDFGGNPLKIPELTHEKMKAFHKKHYCLANCRIFLWGNISTKEQIDFLEKNVLSQITSYGEKAQFPEEDESFVPEKFLELQGPDDGTEDNLSYTNMIWRIGKNIEPSCRSKVTMELLFLSSLLLSSDSAPLSKALLASGLGTEISIGSGAKISKKDFTFQIGLNGVKKEDFHKVEKIIIEELENICRNGISEDDYERACMLFEYSFREIRRTDGPYSIAVLQRSLRGWIYGSAPWESIMLEETFNALKEKISADGNYIVSLIKKYFLENSLRSFVCVTPSKQWNENREKEEQLVALRKLNETGIENVKNQLEKMYAFQNDDKTEKEFIQPVNVKKLDFKLEEIKYSVENIAGLPAVISPETTNGIAYITFAFPADIFPPEDYFYFPLFTQVLTEMGWKGTEWTKASTLIEKTTGNFSCSLNAATVPECSAHIVKENPLIAGREWIMVKVATVEEKIPQAFELLKNCLTLNDFSDTKRLRQIIDMLSKMIASDVVNSSLKYASYRATCSINRTSAVNELCGGISLVNAFKKIARSDLKELGEKLNFIREKLLSGGAVFSAICSGQTLETAKREASAFIKELNLSAPKEKLNTPDEEFISLAENCCMECCASSEEKSEGAGGKAYEVDEVFVIPGSVGYACAVTESSPYGTKEAVADEVFSHSMETSDLWKQIRTSGGAYGVQLVPATTKNSIVFSTYRDPKPFDSINTYLNALKNAPEKELSQDELERIVTGTFSSAIEPSTPRSRGATALWWVLFGFTNEYRKKRIENLLNLTLEDVKKSSLRNSECKKKGRTVVFCSEELLDEKKIKNYGKIVHLTL